MSMDYPEDFFGVNRWIFNATALCLPKNANKCSKIRPKMLLVLISYFSLAEWICVKDSYTDEYDLAKNVTVALTHSLGTVKELFMFYNWPKFEKLMDMLASKQYRYENCEDKEFFPGRISRRYKKIGQFWSWLFLFLSNTTAVTGILPQIILVILTISNSEKYKSPEKLPYFVWVPFGYDSPAKYLLALAYQSVPVFYHAFGIIAMDSLFMNIMNCSAMNLTIIQNAFLTLRERCAKRIISSSLTTSDGLYNSLSLSREMKYEMRRICIHLQLLYKTCEDLENLYKYITLAQTTSSIFILCSSLYLVFMTPFGDDKIYNEIIYIFTIAFQLMLYCWFGNEVTIKASKIPAFLWKSDWFAADTSFKNDMILTMARANKPLYLTAGKFAPLTLGFYMQIVKGSYSLYAFMKNSQ